MIKNLLTLKCTRACVFFDVESDGTIYFDITAEMENIRAIFHLCGWFETTPECGKLNSVGKYFLDREGAILSPLRLWKDPQTPGPDRVKA